MRDDTDLPHSPAAERNRDPILAVLRKHLPDSGIVLEVASGTGQHAVYFARALPRITWQPSEPDTDRCAAVRARVEAAGLANIKDPMDLDVTAKSWPVEGPFDALYCANLIHIAPWAVAEGLMRGAGKYLAPGGRMVLYGPFKMDGRHTAPSNAEFDKNLKARNPSWGVRDMEMVETLAADNGLTLTETVPMPANNFCLVFERG